jgi:hypothetical protein
MGYNQSVMMDEKKPRPEDAVAPLPEISRDDGVDVGLIRWMLSLTPRQRLESLQQAANSLLELRHAKDGD